MSASLVLAFAKVAATALASSAVKEVAHRNGIGDVEDRFAQHGAGASVVITNSHGHKPYRGLRGRLEKYVPFGKWYVNLDDGRRILVDHRDLRLT